MRKMLSVLILVLLAAAAFTPTFAAYAEEVPTFRAMHQDTALYEQADVSSSVLFKLPQGANLVITGEEEVVTDGIAFVRVKYGTYLGYVVKNGIYEIIPPLVFSMTHAKIRAAKFGETCKVYQAPDATSALAYEIKDSKKVEILFDTPNGYTYIRHEGKVGYIENGLVIEKGLTQNERVAIIIGSIGFVFILTTLLLVGYSKNLAKKTKK